MKEFQLLRYLYKGKFIIFIVALVGAIWVYSFANSQQVYTATTVIRYANGAISEGLTPNGSKLDVSEIYSSTVIKGAIEDLGLNCSIDEVRSKMKVRAIIPDEEEQRKETAISKGEEYNYFPTDYVITFEANSEKSMNYVANMLDAVIKNYYMFYSEKYVDQMILPNNAANISSNDYDYIESAEIIQESVKGIDDYLLQKRASYPDFRASATGYTFTDLENIYSYIIKNKVPHLYASIFQGKYTKDNDLLLKKQQNRIEQLDISINNNTQKADKLKYLLDNYSEKGVNTTNSLDDDADAANSGTGSSVIGSNDAGSAIIMDVNGYDRGLNVITTYDDLIQEYVSINQSIKNDEIDKEHAEYIKSVFVGNTQNQVLSDGVEKYIEELVDILNTEYSLVKSTARELNEYIGASYLNILNSVVAAQKVNIKLYLALAVVFFLFFGCVGAVVIGRLKDFIQYILYTDKNTKLPNRQMCDIYINSLATKDVGEQYTCLIIKMTNLFDLNATLGRAAADSVLADFGGMIKSLSRNYGFVGYNNGGQFLGLFDKCTAQKVEMFIEMLQNNVDDYNEKQIELNIKFTAAYVNSTDDGIYDIRDIIHRTYGKL
ncbi:MAG: diguanylate cyclase [Clostridiales bacterium]|nr:diguanylate cyclase [Clostridiales bacterium]